MSNTINITDTLTIISCCNCDMTFAITASFETRRREDHQTFYCPAGHSQSYRGKSATERARQRADELERQLASREEDLRVEKAKTAKERAAHRATKTQLTKTTKRAAAGVCPVESCHRSISSARMAQHVKSHERHGVSA